MIIIKLELNCPTFEFIKETFSSSNLPNEVEITFENKVDNIEELAVISFIINSGYNLIKLNPTNENKTKFIAFFKKKT